MRLFKHPGLAVLLATTAFAFFGSSSANAATTVLCKVEEAPCAAANRWEGILFEAKAEPVKFLGGIFGTVACTSSTLKGTLGASGAPQAVAIESLVFTGCKFGMTNCTVEVPTPGGLDLLRTNLNLGEGRLLNSEIKVVCGQLFVCGYPGEPVFHLLGKSGSEAAKLTASELELQSTGGGFCPATTKLDATYTILVPLPAYVEA